MITTRKCKKCQKKLYRDVWNSKLDIFTCQNDLCPLFRQPQGYILDPKNAKLFPKTEVDTKYSKAAEAQKDRRAREASDKDPEEGLPCDNCGANVVRSPSRFARRKHVFCDNACWQQYRRTHRKKVNCYP